MKLSLKTNVLFYKKKFNKAFIIVLTNKESALLTNTSFIQYFLNTLFNKNKFLSLFKIIYKNYRNKTNYNK